MNLDSNPDKYLSDLRIFICSVSGSSNESELVYIPTENPQAMVDVMTDPSLLQNPTGKEIVQNNLLFITYLLNYLLNESELVYIYY